jgi:hypothetical protein
MGHNLPESIFLHTFSKEVEASISFLHESIN